MEQLSGLDSAFVHQDTSRTPMHVSAVLIYDVGVEGEQAVERQRLLELVQRRLSSQPVFRRRLHRVWMDMDAPYWVDAKQQDIECHLHEAELGANSGWPEFFSLLGRIHACRLDLSRPLWEMTLVHGLQSLEGLPQHGQALVLKVHHAAVDGMSLAAIIAALHSDDETAPGSRQPSGSDVDRWRMMTRANLNLFGRQYKMVDTLGKAIPGFLRARKSQQQHAHLDSVKRRKCRFNDLISENRSCGSILIPLQDMSAVKRAVRRVTLNDIALSIVAGALRSYLSTKGGLPTKPLSCGVPINLRTAEDEEAAGNRMATMIVGLATQMEDPVERLRTIHQYALAGKRRINALGTGTVMDFSDSFMPNVLAESIRAMAVATAVADMPVPYHVIASNVPGPRAPLHLDGARLVVPLGLGTLRDNMGLFHIISNSDSLYSISFTACSRLMPDPAFYRRCLAESRDELIESA